MTNEDAREILEELWRYKETVKYTDIEIREALDLAIKALEQQPCEDCISREAVMKCFKKWQPYMATRLLDYEQELIELPSVTPKALEQTDGDCISRKETIEWLKKVTVTDGITFKTGFEQILYDIEQMPSVTPKTEWIPVSERLPEDYIHVLCQFYLGGMGECYLAHGAFHVVGGLVMTCNEVIAWMPLPEPYKAESEEEE